MDRAPDEWELRVFIEVAETHGHDAAARRLSELRKGGYTRPSVEKVLKKLDAWAGEPLLQRDPADRRLYITERGQRFLESARSVVAQYQVMRGDVGTEQLPVLACMPYHTHFVSLAEDNLLDAHPQGRDKLRVVYLPEQERGESAFRRLAVNLLRGNAYQLIIGPRVTGPDFESTTLYHSQLEAMVGRDYPGDEISLTELVRNHRLLVPPPDMRSRGLLEQQIKAWRIEDPGPSVRIAAETYETATSVMRIRHERRRHDSRVIVVPSDVALAYKEGMEFGGRHAERFKWIPIYHRDDAGTEHLLTFEVCVTVRAERSDLGDIVDTLKHAVRTLNESSPHGGLCGVPFRGGRQQPPSRSDRARGA